MRLLRITVSDGLLQLRFAVFFRLRADERSVEVVVALDGLVGEGRRPRRDVCNGMDAPTRLTASMCQSGSVGNHSNRRERMIERTTTLL